MKAFLSQWKIGVRLGAAFALVFALLAGLSFGAYAELSRVYVNLQNLTQVTIPSLQLIASMDSTATRLRRYNLVHVLSETAEQKADAEKTVRAEADKFSETYRKYERSFLSDAVDRQYLATLGSAWQQYAAGWEQARKASDDALVDRSAFERARAEVTTTLGAQFRVVSTALEQMRAHQQTVGDQAAKDAEKSFAQAQIVLGAGATAILMMLIAIGIVITRSVTGRLTPLLHAANAIANGDLTTDIAVEGGDEIAELMAAMARMRENLQRLLGEIRGSVESVAGASNEIASGNQDLSSRTESQAASLEQTAASMEELSAAIRRNLESSQTANQLATATTQIASEGAVVVKRVIATMEEISLASKKISRITKIIDDIAFQTNILALNAAVESARAGNLGRGFAVVAAEVRSLALRAADSAREIRELVRVSGDHVQAGVDLAVQAGQTMNKIEQSVRGVSERVAEITVASHEQASGVDQISDAVIQLDGATQQNAALVEESAAAATSLSEQARSLSDVVTAFRTAAPRFANEQGW